MQHLRPKNRQRLLFLFLLVNVNLGIFLLLIQETFEALVKHFHLSTVKELLILLSILAFGMFLMYVMYRQLLMLFLATPLAKDIIGEDAQEDFYILLNKHKNEVKLTPYETERLTEYIKSSPLPNDYLTRVKFGNVTMFHILLVYLMVVVLFIGFNVFKVTSKFKKEKKEGNHESDSDSGEISK